MAAQALYRKWRSQTFEEVVGQDHVTLTLRNALRDGHMSHAYLFTGPRGTGKTSTARILAKAINCLAEDPAERPCNHCHICTAIGEARLLDLIEIDAASNRGIDEIRELREKIGFRPSEARYKVYIVDEVHMLTKEAFNALLKTLEEPPAHALFVLATTEPDRVPETVRSRCQRFDFRRVPVRSVADHLAKIVRTENVQASPEALLAIARRSTGSMRDAISLLDQLLSYGDEVLELSRVQDVLGLVDGHSIGQLVDCMANHDAATGLKLINEMVSGGVELGELVEQIMVYLRAVLFVQVSHAPDLLEMPEDLAAMVQRQAGALAPAVMLNALREFSEARAALRDQIPGAPQLPIELALVRSALATAPAISSSATQPAPPSQATASQAKRKPEVVAAPGSVATGAEPTVAAPAVARGGAGSAPVTSSPDESSDVGLRATTAQRWEQILDIVRQRHGPLIKAALQATRQYEVANGVLTLEFEHDTPLRQLEKEENRVKVESVLKEVLGSSLRVRCMLVKEKRAPAAQPPARQAAAPRGEGEDVLLDDARKLGAIVKRLDP